MSEGARCFETDFSSFKATSCGTLTEDELVFAARQDTSGSEMLELLRRVSPFLLCKSQRFGSTEQDRQDYYQEGVVGFLSAVFAYKPDSGASFTTFANTCALNRMKNLFRRRCKDNEYQLLSDTAELETQLSVNPEQALQAAVEAENIISAISMSLSAYEKQVLSLHLSGESYSAIAEKTGKSVKSVDNCLQRIRRKLRPEKDD